jgi:hypothetical protein
MDIHLHSSTAPGMLKSDINNKDEVVSSILPSKVFGDEIQSNNQLPDQPVDRLKELREHDTMRKLNSIIKQMTGFSCIAEYNHHRRTGG